MSVTCTRCGLAAPDAGTGTGTGTPPPTWSCSLDEPAGPQWLCGACTREHLRSIEGKLAEQWW